jgi:membrane protein DedA with SNARE-associated domain
VDSTALWKFLGVLGTLLAAGMGLPIPEELPIVTAGAMVGHSVNDPSGHHLIWWIMLPTCIIGVVVGDGILYTIGRLWGYRVLNIRWVRTRLLPPEKRERIERNFHRYGVWILLGARLLPGIRSPIFLMAGMNRLPLIKFLIADGLYAIPGVSMLFGLAYVFTDQFVALVENINNVRPTIIACLIAGSVGYLIRYFQEHPVSTGDPAEVPVIGQQIVSHLKDPDACAPADARTRLGESITVEMTPHAARDCMDKSGEIYLHAEPDSRDEKNFALVITRNGAASLKSARIENPAEHFMNRKIRATGTVTQVDGLPRIEIDDARQIHLTDEK